MTFENSEQAEFWTVQATVWRELEERIEVVSRAPGQLAMDGLGLEPGQKVVDLGCGLGATTVELARRVTPGGSVLGVDIAASMVAAAEERAARLGAADVSFRLADVQTADLGESVFDAAFSRFGVMFFKDPVRAFTNVRRALKRGGRLCFVCWLPVLENEWMSIPGLAAMSVIGPIEMPAPNEPGPFSLSDPARVREVLQSAGFSDVTIAEHREPVSHPADGIPELADTSMRVGGLSRALADVDTETRETVRQAVEQSLRDRAEGGMVTFSRGVLLVAAAA